MYCKHCGIEIEEDSTFCKHCGEKQNNIEKETNSTNTNNNTKPGCLSILGIIVIIVATLVALYFAIITHIEDCKDNTTDTSSETSDTSKDTNDTSTDTDDYMRQAGANDIIVNQQENYPDSINYTITAKRDIYDLEIELLEYAEDGSLTRTKYYYIGDLKKGESQTLILDVSNYTVAEINNIGTVYTKVVGGTTSSLTVLPVA